MSISRNDVSKPLKVNGPPATTMTNGWSSINHNVDSRRTMPTNKPSSMLNNRNGLVTPFGQVEKLAPPFIPQNNKSKKSSSSNQNQNQNQHQSQNQNQSSKKSNPNADKFNSSSTSSPSQVQQTPPPRKTVPGAAPSSNTGKKSKKANSNQAPQKQ